MQQARRRCRGAAKYSLSAACGRLSLIGTAMAHLRQRVNVSTNGAARSILMIEEAAKGDVYIRIKSGTQVGVPPNAVAVLQDRYSVHPSPKSPNYTTLKSTVELADGRKRTSVALTDAVKLRRGFAHLFTHRSSDLEAPIYDLPVDNIGTIGLGDFDPNQQTLITGVFIGHPDSEFPTAPANALVNSFNSTHFKFVICHHWLDIPALPFAWSMNSLTFAPEIFEDDQSREAALKKLEGQHPQSCLELFENFSNELLVNLLETYLVFAPDEEFRRNIQKSKIGRAHV